MRPESPASTAGIPGLGELFAGTYRVQRVLGRGAMGMVVEAEHVSLRRRVAVKFLLPRAMRVPWASARFLREARATAAIRSAHVASVIDAGISESGIPFIVMEHLAGSDIQSVLDRRGPLPLEEAVEYVLQACKAVAKAHALGIVHRDLKPGNLFLAADSDGVPLVKVLDFGLSKALGDVEATDGKLTSAATVLGSPCYMSPEQVRSARDVDERTDIWSLGVILYQLLTARFPFEAPSVSALLAAVVADEPTPPRAHRPDMPSDLEALILRCLDKDVGARIQSVADLTRALDPFGSRQSRWAAERVARRRCAAPPSRRTARRRVEIDSQSPTIREKLPAGLCRPAAREDDGPTLVSPKTTPEGIATRVSPRRAQSHGAVRTSSLRGRPSVPSVHIEAPARAASDAKTSVAGRRRGGAMLVALVIALIALIAATAVPAMLWNRGASIETAAPSAAAAAPAVASPAAPALAEPAVPDVASPSTVVTAAVVRPELTAPAPPASPAPEATALPAPEATALPARKPAKSKRPIHRVGNARTATSESTRVAMADATAQLGDIRPSR